MTKLVLYPKAQRVCNTGISLGRFVAVLMLTAAATIVRAEPLPAEMVAPDSPLVKGAELTLTVADYRQAMLGVPPEVRSQIGHDATTLREFLMQLYGEQRIVQEAQRLGLPDQPEVQAVLATARRQVLVNTVIDRFKTHLQLPDFTELAREYYLTHRHEFTQPEQIRAAHILLRAQCPCEDENGQKRQQAEAVLAELRQGADFAALALKYSEDEVTAKQGGQMKPWIKRGILTPPFEEAVFALTEPGMVSEVVKTTYGYHIIKLLAHQPETVLPFEQVQKSIIEKLAGQYRLIAQKEYESRFLPTMDQIDQTTIEALLKAAPASSAPPEASSAVKVTP